ncbi:hypothetical protein PSPO01_03777 [Paraphaeosphaeria sporulosa]
MHASSANNLTANSPQASRGTTPQQPMGLCQAAHPEHAARRRLTSMHLRRAATCDFAPASHRTPSCEASSAPVARPPAELLCFSPRGSTAHARGQTAARCASLRERVKTESPPFNRACASRLLANVSCFTALLIS